MSAGDRITGLLVATACIGLLWLAGRAVLVGDPPAVERTASAPVPSQQPAARPTAETAAPPVPAGRTGPDVPASLPPAPHPTTIRNVTPDDILPPPPVSGPLKRVEPRLPKLPEREIPTEVTFHQPVVLDAGNFRTKKLTIRLAGIDAPALEETCPSRLGGDWPCGRRARTALRALVRRHAITCDNMEKMAGGVVLATCRRRGVDLSAWMVEQGWARPQEGAAQALVDAAEAARAARKGLWQLDWSARLPRTGASQDAASEAEAGIAPLLEGEPVEIVDTPWYPQGDRLQPGDSTVE
jgi:endonuclease YncB( thermonuclease family)